MFNVLEIEMALIKSGFTKIIQNVEFVLIGDTMEVIKDFMLIDTIDCTEDGLPTVNTEYDFDMTAMWWMYEYNII